MKLRLPNPVEGIAAIRGWSRTGYQSVVPWAFLLALPLILVGLAASQLLEADYFVTRSRTHAQAERHAERLGAAVGAALTDATRALRDRLVAREGTDGAISAARSLLYANAASAIVLRRDRRRVFPPDDGEWVLTEGMAAQVRALEAAASLQLGTTSSAGWYAGPMGPVFFECAAAAADEQTCVALDWPHVETIVGDALSSAAVPMTDWSFRVRDPFDRFVWARGSLQVASGDAVDLSGPMRGWRIIAAGSPVGILGFSARVALAVPISIAWLALVWSKVRRHRDQLAESAARADLLAKLSHDLRTPLANLKLYSELIARQVAAGPSGLSRVSEYCRVLDDEIDRLDRFAGNTIAFGTTASRIRNELAVPDDVVGAIVARHGRLLEVAGCRCEVDGDARETCRFDRAGLERILVNLLDNARKYAPGAIQIATTLQARQLRLSVRDWGGGFSAPKQADGFGLGLAVVRDLARANGGDVTLVRCSPGTRVDVTMMVASVGTGTSA